MTPETCDWCESEIGYCIDCGDPVCDCEDDPCACVTEGAGVGFEESMHEEDGARP